MVLFIGLMYVLYKISTDLGYGWVASIFKFFVTLGIVGVVVIIALIILPIILAIIILVLFFIRRKKVMKEYQKMYQHGTMYHEHQQAYDAVHQDLKKQKKETVIDAEFKESP